MSRHRATVPQKLVPPNEDYARPQITRRGLHQCSQVVAAVREELRTTHLSFRAPLEPAPFKLHSGTLGLSVRTNGTITLPRTELAE